jgi:hypothetical protein
MSDATQMLTAERKVERHTRALIQVASDRNTAMSERHLMLALEHTLGHGVQRHLNIVKRLVRKELRKRALRATALVPADARNRCARIKSLKRITSLRFRGDQEANERIVLASLRRLCTLDFALETPLAIGTRHCTALEVASQLKAQMRSSMLASRTSYPDRERVPIGEDFQVMWMPKSDGSETFCEEGGACSPTLQLVGAHAPGNWPISVRAQAHAELSGALEGEDGSESAETRREVRHRNLMRWRNHIGNAATDAAGDSTSGYGELEKWTQEEEREFMRAFEKHGRNFRRVAQRIGTGKTQRDCVSYYYNVRRLRMDEIQGMNTNAFHLLTFIRNFAKYAKPTELLNDMVAKGHSPQTLLHRAHRLRALPYAMNAASGGPAATS